MSNGLVRGEYVQGQKGSRNETNKYWQRFHLTLKLATSTLQQCIEKIRIQEACTAKWRLFKKQWK